MSSNVTSKVASKISVVLYGSCQCEALNVILKNKISRCDEIFDIQQVTNWKYIVSQKPLPETMFDADVFIYQPFKSTNGKSNSYQTKPIIERIKIRKPDLKTISFPFMDFRAYFPHHVTTKEHVRSHPSYPFGKFPMVHQDMIDHLKSLPRIENDPDGHREKLDEYVQLLHDESFMSKESIEQNANVTFASSRRRDSECSIQLTDYIETHYKDRRLFHTIQHPCNELLMYVADKVIEMLAENAKTHLGITIETTDWYPSKELLGDYELPILPCVAQGLSLKFPLQQKWYNGKSVSLTEYATSFYTTCVPIDDNNENCLSSTLNR
jgi:hypothetical protein